MRTYQGNSHSVYPDKWDKISIFIGLANMVGLFILLFTELYPEYQEILATTDISTIEGFDLVNLWHLKFYAALIGILAVYGLHLFLLLKKKSNWYAWFFCIPAFIILWTLLIVTTGMSEPLTDNTAEMLAYRWEIGWRITVVILEFIFAVFNGLRKL